MILGQVTSDKEAVVPLGVYDTHAGLFEFDAVLDTGFTAYLTLSPTEVVQLGLVRVHVATVTLGDGSEVSVPVYRAEVPWHGQKRLIYVHATDGGALVGMSLLYGSLLTIRIVDGGEVKIEPLV